MAKLKKTPKGYRVVHSRTGQPLTGTFTGRGARARALDRLRLICKRNRRRCRVR